MGNPYFTFLPWEVTTGFDKTHLHIYVSSAFNNKTFALNCFVLADQLERCASILSFFHLCKNNFSKKQALIPNMVQLPPVSAAGYSLAGTGLGTPSARTCYLVFLRGILDI
jgi:hypothetical protein